MGQPAVITSILPPDIHPVVFDSIDACRKSAAGLDAYAWRRLCTIDSLSLCQSLAEVAKRLCSSFQGISPLLACRLIALPWCMVLEKQRDVSSQKLSLGSRDPGSSGRYVVGAVKLLFTRQGSTDDTEAVLLIDASNAGLCTTSSVSVPPLLLF